MPRLLRTLIIETEARMTNLREQRRADLNTDLPAAYETTLNDLCFGWSVEPNLMYAPPPTAGKKWPNSSGQHSASSTLQSATSQVQADS
jgi:hypothetical protein